jgi:hypothetical protein
MTNNTKAATRKRTKTPASKVTKLDRAKLMVQEDEKKRQAECAAELEVVLLKYGYSLQTTPAQIILVPRGNIPMSEG